MAEDDRLSLYPLQWGEKFTEIGGVVEDALPRMGFFAGSDKQRQEDKRTPCGYKSTSVLTDAELKQIVEMKTKGERSASIAARFNIRRQTVNAIYKQSKAGGKK